MPDLTNRELDDLFREGADLQEFSYNEAAWADVNSRLNREDRRRKWFILFFSLLSLSIVATGIGFFLYSDNESDSTQETAVIEKKDNSSTSDDLIQESIDHQISSVQEPASLEGRKSLTITRADVKEKIQKHQVPVSNSIVEKTVQGQESSTIISEDDTQTATAKIAEGVSTLKQEVDFAELLAVRHVWQDARLSENRISLLNHDYAYTLLELPGKPLKARSTHGLIVTLAGSAEWSSVDMEPFGKIGHKWEAKIGYQFAKRFELSTGVAYAKKMFQTTGATFQADENIWTDDIVPETVYGEDDVIEIPIDFTYYHAGYSNAGLFANIGLRSYMMHEETFNFVYSPLDPRPDLIQNYRMVDEHEHWFGILRFSAGYQYRLGDYQSIQIAPFVQVPITDIGHGNQRIYSAGIQIASRFNMR